MFVSFKHHLIYYKLEILKRNVVSTTTKTQIALHQIRVSWLDIARSILLFCINEGNSLQPFPITCLGLHKKPICIFQFVVYFKSIFGEGRNSGNFKNNPSSSLLLQNTLFLIRHCMYVVNHTTLSFHAFYTYGLIVKNSELLYKSS